MKRPEIKKRNELKIEYNITEKVTIAKSNWELILQFASLIVLLITAITAVISSRSSTKNAQKVIELREAQIRSDSINAYKQIRSDSINTYKQDSLNKALELANSPNFLVIFDRTQYIGYSHSLFIENFNKDVERNNVSIEFSIKNISDKTLTDIRYFLEVENRDGKIVKKRDNTLTEDEIGRTFYDLDEKSIAPGDTSRAFFILFNKNFHPQPDAIALKNATLIIEGFYNSKKYSYFQEFQFLISKRSDHRIYRKVSSRRELD